MRYASSPRPRHQQVQGMALVNVRRTAHQKPSDPLCGKWQPGKGTGQTPVAGFKVGPSRMTCGVNDRKCRWPREEELYACLRLSRDGGPSYAPAQGMSIGVCLPASFLKYPLFAGTVTGASISEVYGM